MTHKRYSKILLPAVLCVVVLAMDAANIIERETGGNDSIPGKTSGESVVDIDGNVYHTVTIGSQVWLIENLRVTRYHDGTPIPGVPDSDTWCDLKTGAYCAPVLDSTADVVAYGLLYNFHAVNDSRGLCPEGWHVPTAEEWRALIEYLGGDQVAGGRMRETDSGHWLISVPGSTNESGFTALPAGGRGRYGGPSDVGRYATWWSSTSYDRNYAWHWGLHPDKHDIRFNPGHKASGFSVRCIRD